MARPKAYKGHNPLYGYACAAFSIHSATICYVDSVIPQASTQAPTSTQALVCTYTYSDASRHST